MQLIGWPIVGLLIAVFVFFFHGKDKDRGYVYFLCVVAFILPTVLGLLLASASTRLYYPVESTLVERNELAPFLVAGAQHPVYLEIENGWFGTTAYSYFEVSADRTSVSPKVLVTLQSFYVTEFVGSSEPPVMERWNLRYNCSRFLGPSWIYPFTYCPRNDFWNDWYKFRIPAGTLLKMP